MAKVGKHGRDVLTCAWNREKVMVCPFLRKVLLMLRALRIDSMYFISGQGMKGMPRSVGQVVTTKMRPVNTTSVGRDNRVVSGAP